MNFNFKNKNLTIILLLILVLGSVFCYNVMHKSIENFTGCFDDSLLIYEHIILGNDDENSKYFKICKKSFNDEQVKHRNMIVEVEHPDGGFVKMPGNPVKMSYTNEESYSSPPHLGTNTREILKNWSKYQDDEIESLEKEKIIQSID